MFRCLLVFFFFKQKTAYEMRISDWSSDVCSSDLSRETRHARRRERRDVRRNRDHLKPLRDAQRRDDRVRQDGYRLAVPPAGGDNSLYGIVESRSEERRVGKECVSTGRSGW